MPRTTRKRKNPGARAPRLALLVRDRRWRLALPAVGRLFAPAAKAALKTVKPGQAPSAFTLVLASDAEIRGLNRRFRGRDRPTNVLSFQGLDGKEGEIILAFETCRREAREQGKSLADHARHLLVHGILHVLGHDHERPASARRMEALETKILKSLRIPNPYAIREKSRG